MAHQRHQESHHCESTTRIRPPGPLPGRSQGSWTSLSPKEAELPGESLLGGSPSFTPRAMFVTTQNQRKHVHSAGVSLRNPNGAGNAKDGLPHPPALVMPFTHVKLFSIWQIPPPPHTHTLICTGRE